MVQKKRMRMWIKAEAIGWEEEERGKKKTEVEQSRLVFRSGN